jgi:hypothetical protein
MAVLALALTGCGGSTPAASDGTVTLRFSWWGSDVRHKMTEKLIAAFEAENPNIKVEGEYGDWSGYWDKLATQVASQDAPDIIQMDAQYLGEYAERGALLELKDVDLSKFDKAAADAGKTADGQFAVTAGMNALVVLANPALLSASGVSLPDDSSWPGMTTRKPQRTSPARARRASTVPGASWVMPPSTSGCASTGSPCSPKAAAWALTRPMPPNTSRCRPSCGMPKPFRVRPS